MPEDPSPIMLKIKIFWEHSKERAPFVNGIMSVNGHLVLIYGGLLCLHWSAPVT